MKHEIDSAETAGGRLGAVLSAPREPGVVLLSPVGPWLVTSSAQARQVLTNVEAFTFPAHVSRGADLSGSVAATRSGHHVFTPLSREAVGRGMAVFAAEWATAVGASPRGTAHDVMRVLRQPVARATCAAVLPDADSPRRERIADLVLGWIDALGPIIAARRPPGRLSRTRRCEARASAALEAALAEAASPHSDAEAPNVVATMLAAGVQVPIAAGAWLLVWLASHPDGATDPDHAVWETLRLTPPTWVTARVAIRDVRLGDREVSAGSLVLVSPLLLGRLTDLVPGDDQDRSAFDPQRWETDEVRPGAWLPFGAGPHACPGRSLGLAMLRHLAEWGIDQRLALVEPVGIDQSRGIAPHPARVVAADRGVTT